MTEDFYTYDETEDREISETAQPQEDETQDSHFGVARIKVIGVGGAGGNAVNRLIESGLKAAEYYVINTDNQVLARSLAQNRIQIGVKLTKGLGAGADPSVGKLSADENKDRIQQILKGTDLARDYARSPFHIPDMDEYIRCIGNCIAHLRPDIVIHRLTGDGPKDLLIEPQWTGAKRTVLNHIHQYLKKQDIWQGKEYYG